MAASQDKHTHTVEHTHTHGHAYRFHTQAHTAHSNRTPLLASVSGADIQLCEAISGFITRKALVSDCKWGTVQT